MRGFFFLIATILVEGGSPQVVKRNRGLEVANGRMEYLDDDVLQFNFDPQQICKVEVVQNEPMYQRVGVIIPEVFDCSYPHKSVRYEHNGSPFLRSDEVKLRAYILDANQTIEESFVVEISIVDSRCDIIQINGVMLTVPTTSKMSNPVTRDVMQFDYDRDFDTLCEVMVERKDFFHFPAHGQLVAPSNQTSPRPMSRDAEYAPLAFDSPRLCDEFLLMGVRYEHLSPPTPDVDYIPIHVVVKDRRSMRILQQERHWLPVTITDAFPNQPPKASFSNMYILEVDQFVVTNLLPMTVAAVDGETPNERLVFNITKAPEQGFMTHLSDESQPITSFRQQDLQDLQIAYNPPNRSFSERQTFEVEFVVYDEYFSESRPMKCLLSVRVSYTNAPHVSWNKGLIMLEGQSRTIDHNCLQVVDNDDINQVRFILAGGMQRGRLYVNSRPGFTFRWNDIENGLVSYHHDDTDTRKDFVVFRITDGLHSTRFKLPIRILPKDDAPPFLINNIVFEVQEGQTIMIHRFMLEASDADSSADFIQFNITTPPRAGEVQKKRKWERAGWSVGNFQQSDLYQGLIYYKHLGSEEFEDSFEFQMIDSSRPTPNISPTQRVSIKITPVNDQPPQPSDGNSLSLIVNETDVIHINSKELHYVDVEDDHSDVTYTVTTPTYRVDGTDRDAGRLIFTDDLVMLMKDPSVPVLRTFTQSAVNHRKVAYMPPIADVGLHPVDVQFVFSVSDDGGKALDGKKFVITILPVDNLAPNIKVTELCLNEGGSEIIAADVIQLRDDDTTLEDLKLILTIPPQAGAVMRDNSPLQVGDIFTMRDVELFRISYAHDGSEQHQDEIEITVTDGNQNHSAILPIKMEAIDDEQPTITSGNGSLVVEEGGAAALTSAFLAATDVDTDDESLIFEVLTPPQLGDITINGEPAITFKQSDITNGRVYYTHNGGEVGKSPIQDIATVMVSDRRGVALDIDGVTLRTKDLRFTIKPTNTRPPRVALGRRVFLCDEGGVQPITSHYIMADDVDTPSANLTYLVTSPPTFGYLEDMTPRPGYEKTIGKMTTSFSHEQLMSGFIRYKQSEHEGIEPTSDQFSVAVTDGQHRSAEVPFLISITPQNDEEPIISVENVTCEEGHMRTLQLSIEDLDQPEDEVMIRVSQEPHHGMVMDEMEMLTRLRRDANRQFPGRHPMHGMEAMEEFSLYQLHNNMVLPAYMHDGSEHHRDWFELKITDGRHTRRQPMVVDVIPMNDERPIIARNRGITLELGGTRVISGVALQTSDDDTTSSELVYELYSVPRRGYLQLKTDDNVTSWINLDYGDTFTEYDVEMNRLRYKHASVLGSKGQDSFRFSVTDGEFTTTRQNFVITIEHTKKSAIHVITHPLRVNEGQQVFVTTDVIVARDDSHRPQEITYDLIRPPTQGHLEYVTFPNVPIEMFTQLDLLARHVVYNHTSKLDIPFDTFRVLASNGLKEREADVNVLVTAVDAELPTLFMDSLDAGSGRQLMLYSGSSVAISNMIINIEDPDSAKGSLKLVLTELPQHGSLSVGGIKVNERNRFVTQQDLEGGDFTYQHSGDGSRIDRFMFTVTDGVHTGFMYLGRRCEEPVTFYLKIESIDEDPPTLAINREPTSIDASGRGRAPFYKIHLDSNALRAEDAGTTDPSEIAFTVTQPPSYGVIKRVGGDELDALHFTQDDLNHRAVIYVISSKLDVTNDSFTFDVEDSWGNTLTDNKFTMSWSRIEMTQARLKVCENIGSLSISIRRYGNLMTSSFSGIKIKSASAKSRLDFESNSASQIQFDPDVSHREWEVSIVNDDLEERKERFLIKLHTPVNCVLTPRKTSTSVVILDRSRLTCSPQGGGRGTNKRRKKTNKLSGKENSKQLQLSRDDSSLVPGSAAPRKVRYGKLGHGATIPPSTYFRNRTTRIWTYHGILPATVDEADERSLGVPLVGRFTTSLQKDLPRQPTGRGRSPPQEVQDDPTVALRQPGEPLYQGNLKVENSDALARVVIHGRNDEITSREQQHEGTEINKPCILTTRGRLFYDPVAKILYHCDGAKWVPWKRTSLKSGKQKLLTQNSEEKFCEDGWKDFENRCFLFLSSGRSEISWNAAQRICREEHSAHLVSVQNRKQLNWLWKLAGKSQFWIGLNRKLNPTVWEWVGGDEAIFTNWKRNYPTSEGGDCVVVASKKRWMNIPCAMTSTESRFICARDP
ncbi:FRAS1-related extracellular matrix protein 1-like isoform X1 [Clavelina lepadiformis]|uniref:FRAS1-related extracellular matrix protein 1-like isoform X1 n=1 Tax=Clavelina lepadiformis TaxID=159417 RepID=UPI00404171AC